MDAFTNSPTALRIEVEQDKRIKIAYLHHNEDSPYFNPFYHKHLALLRRRGKIFDDLPEVPVGARFLDYMKPQFENADVLILFLSIDLEKDEYSTSSSETIALIDACQKKGTRIWKVLVKSYWGGSVFQEYGDFLAKGKSIPSIANSSDEALGQIVGEIDNEVTHMLSEKWAQEGDKYYHQMCFDEALVAYDNSIGYISDYPPALLGKWRIFRKREMSEEEEQYFQRLLSLDTSLPQKGKDVLSFASQRISLIRSYYKGCAWLERGDFNDAHTAFREVFQRITSSGDKIQKKLCARAYYGEGDTFISEGRRAYDFANYYNQAFTAYRMAGQLDPNDSMYLTKLGDAHVAFAEAYTILNDSTQVKSHCYDALENYEQVISNNSYPPAFVGQGDVYFLLQHFNKALAFYESALSDDQYAARAHRGKGNVLLAFNKPEEALHAFEEALFIDNCDALYHYGKGRALARLKRYREALESYEKACHFGIPHSAEFMINYARTLIELGDAEYAYGQHDRATNYYTKALDAYQRALQLGGSGKDVNYGYGKIWLANKDRDKALIWFNKALSLDPFMSEAYLEKGKIYLEIGNVRDALDCFDLANKYCREGSMIDKSDVEAARGDTDYYYAEHCDSKDRDSFLEKACSHYEKAISTRQNAMAYAGLGKTYAEIHRDQEAIDALNHALELMPNLVQCYLIKGKCYYYLGQYSEAYTEYEKAFKAGLDTVLLQKAFGEVLLVMKRYKDALQIINAIINHMYSDIYAYNDQDFSCILCNKGIALHGQGEDGKAILCFFKAYEYDQSISWERQYRQVLEDIYYNCQKKLSVNPDSSALYKYKGDVLRLLGEENEKAIDAYTAAIAYGDTSADTYYSRGLIYEKLRDYQNAFNDYCAVLQIDQNHQSAQQAKLRVEGQIVQPQISLWQKLKSLPKLFS